MKPIILAAAPKLDSECYKVYCGSNVCAVVRLTLPTVCGDFPLGIDVGARLRVGSHLIREPGEPASHLLPLPLLHLAGAGPTTCCAEKCLLSHLA